MNQDILDRVTECQASLIDALDSQDVDAIEKSTGDLAAMLDEISSLRPFPPKTDDNARLDYAIRQSNAASMRVNYLSSWTRQRIDRLAELRGGNLAGKH